MTTDTQPLDQLQNDEAYEQKIYEEIIKVVEIKSVQEARIIIDTYPNAHIAEQFARLEKEKQITFLRLLKTADAADLFSFFEDDLKRELAVSFSEPWAMKILQELQSDELADVIDELPANVISKILAYTPKEKIAEINKILSYQDDEVGSIMSIDISSLLNSYTCEQALYKIKRDYGRKNAELVHYYYVVDEKNKLLGTLTFEEIVFNDGSTKLDELYSPVTSVTANSKKADAAKIFSEHDMSTLPVTNNENRLLGMITSDDVIDVIQDEATEDLYKYAGISSNAATGSDYIKTPWYKLVGYRILWLSLFLIFGTFLQALIETSINLTIGKGAPAEFANPNLLSFLPVSLASLFPIIIVLINNAAWQSSLSFTRAYSLDEIEKKQFKKAFRKELLVSTIIGLILSIINVLRLVPYYAITENLTDSRQGSLTWAIIIGTSIVILLSIFICNLISILIPIIMIKMKKDPSALSGIIMNFICALIVVLIAFIVMFIAVKIATL
ncbi:magnesium transporter [Mycoplasmopsis opalescens]|uniref:magnesium transporter n=1 Tax=Mycoplasmopsis opalescens TaxID=114886 RepID=UPI00068D663E|nr:magnesium transporter [Mycoplasmopsis opalescens]